LIAGPGRKPSWGQAAGPRRARSCAEVAMSGRRSRQFPRLPGV